MLKSVMETLDRRGIPAPDEKLKRIVGAQVNALVKGGYDLDRISHFARELALSWDNARGHQRMLGLRQRVIQDAAGREYRLHEARKRIAAESVPAHSAAAIAVLNLARKSLVRHEPATRGDWTVQCGAVGCVRTALYANAHCADHAS